MTQRDQSAEQPANAAMLTMLRACGFDVSVFHGLPFQSSEVYGTIDNAMELFKLAVAGADVAVQLDRGANLPVQQPAPTAKPILWANFAENGSVRLWSSVPDQARKLNLVPLYTAAPVPAASVHDKQEQEYIGTRLRRVAKAAGVTADYGNDVAYYAGAFSILGDIARALGKTADSLQLDSGRDAARLDAFIDWYLRGGQRSEIHADGHMVHTTRTTVTAALDAMTAQNDGAE